MEIISSQTKAILDAIPDSEIAQYMGYKDNGSALKHEQGLLTVAETLEFLRISRMTLHRLVNDKKIKMVSIGRRSLFDRRDLDRFISRQKVTQTRKQPKTWIRRRENEMVSEEGGKEWR